jgi:hypothetical protein
MLKKDDRFALIAETSTAGRIVKVYRKISYLHSSFTPEYEHYYNITNLPFWAMVFITLLNSEKAESVIGDFLFPLKSLPKYEDHLRTLVRYLEATSRGDLKKSGLRQDK